MKTSSRTDFVFYLLLVAVLAWPLIWYAPRVARIWVCLELFGIGLLIGGREGVLPSPWWPWMGIFVVLLAIVGLIRAVLGLRGGGDDGHS